MILNKIKTYLLELRAPFLTVTIIPVVIGFIPGKNKDLYNFLLVFFGFVFLHLGTNVINDYFDYKNGTDNINKKYIFPFTGGSRLIQSGILKPQEVLIEAILLYLIAIVFFIPLIIKSGMPVFFVLLFSLIAGVFYTAPPFKWAHRGMGEILIFFCFGPLMVITSYYVQGGHDFFIPFLVSLPVGLLAASIIDINEFPDFEADKSTGKENLIVRLGVEKGRFLHLIIFILAYFFLFLLIYFKILSYIGLLVLLTLPISIKIIQILFKNYKNPEKLSSACALTILNHLSIGVILIVSLLK